MSAPCLTPYQRLRIDRGAAHLHRCGPRATAEFLLQLSHTIGGLPAITALLTEYEARLRPELLRAVGGDRFPTRRPLVVPPELREVSR